MPMLSFLAANILHFPISWFLIEYMRMSVIGAALAKNFTDIFGCLLTLFLMKFLKYDKDTTLPWNSAALKEWKSFLIVTVPMGLITYLEWLSFELTTLQAGSLGDREHDLASHIIMVNSFSFMSVVPLGLATAVATFVGNSVGEGSAEKA